jgi:SAM-dependent methyltransferase
MNPGTAEAGASLGMEAGAVFDRMAGTYDQDFTDTLIGRAQRDEVWKVLLSTFRAHDNILELNCGTGEDAFFLAAHGASVLSCDASQQMILRAEYRLQQHPLPPPIVFCQLPTERIGELDPPAPFDGVFSNFSGLNCVDNLPQLAADLAKLTAPGSPVVLCLSTRYCLMEILYYMLQCKPRKALRRCAGRTHAWLDGAPLTVYYPTLAQLRRSFAPYFRLRSVRGIGVAIPPSYLEQRMRRHPSLFRMLCRIEASLASLPLLRTSGDHLLLGFQRVTP